MTLIGMLVVAATPGNADKGANENDAIHSSATRMEDVFTEINAMLEYDREILGNRLHQRCCFYAARVLRLQLPREGGYPGGL
jgi:hypothetical protein